MLTVHDIRKTFEFNPKNRALGLHIVSALQIGVLEIESFNRVFSAYLRISISGCSPHLCLLQ